MMPVQKNNWIGYTWIEAMGILMVPFLCACSLFFIPSSVLQADTIPEYMWLFLVVFIDVGHVYSTLYRTYADKPLVNKHKRLFFGLPCLLWFISVLCHSISALLFWRLLAYLAVYHFIRQQYGFLKIYSRKNNYPISKQKIDAFTIYGVTLLPILFWHASDTRQFNWFVKGDFYLLNLSPVLSSLIIGLFWVVIGIYLISEVFQSVRDQRFNIQKNAVVFGTALSWYVGIIYFNSDLVFTLLNIVCHGIPYMTLVWIHGKKSNALKHSQGFFKHLYGRFSLLVFVIPLILFAYLEEGFWDAFVWTEHGQLFFLFKDLQVSLSKVLLNLVVPLLALPQLFHYVIDGFIWKIRRDAFEWTQIL